ncbi:hypothetical protein QVD17_00539 [Tagetes erecta]|uniref:Protein kinase domain-containing protein n=1 Tax=Tagetes erecta TaxID=13708 RepID=A0AAD8L8U4_TARER|nr:hypothetical protein QVD17_00539 [Tagetes erecta]
MRLPKDDLLKQVQNGRRELDWLSRYKIVLGEASGLEYLHVGITPRIVHRDIKPGNVLLDENMEARIADFGRELDWLARYKIVLGEASGLEYLHVGITPRIVHRDIKPGNVLFDENMEARIADFGRELDWLARYTIVLGEASGLEYLHVGITPRIVHRDIKPGNVLLDENMEARIADFGRELDWLARYKIVLGEASGLEYLHVGITPRIVHRDIKPGNVLFDENMEARIADFGRELDWLARYTIVLGEASGLEYLHVGITPRIVHRDIKPGNVLLDENMEARIADFGLDDLLKQVQNGRRELDWLARYKIVLGEASGLENLHVGITPRIVHRDIKPGNVLFDENMEARIADFGLDDLLKQVQNGRRELDWLARYKIVLGEASGLEYLHVGITPRIVHRDIKPGNVLFDENMEARIADFGLDDLLKQVQNGRRELDWLARYKIVLGEASGLEYLHVGITPRIVHRDIKPGNVLFDENMEARIADFGLDDLLKQVQNGRRELDWLARYKIVLGEASGLEYLHVGITPRIVHRDIKPGNVMFDENMEARIADFGRELDWLARYKIVLGEASGLEYLHVGITPRIVHRDIKPGNVLLDENMEARIADFGRELDWLARYKIVLGEASGLEYLHVGITPRIVHRDIKPGNVLFDENMEARIADFGLDDLLKQVQNGRRELDWLARYKIVLGEASGLEYLHVGITPRIVHRDIKPGNVLFDENMEARIADFGLDNLLKQVQNGRRELDWLARYKIVLGEASGLEYLHVGITPRIVHRDIKPGNVLFDENMEARIADFGRELDWLARYKIVLGEASGLEYLHVDDLLKQVQNGRRELDWLARYKIVLGEASGLEYLHVGITPRIVHRDIKPGNVLFDENMEARIADFGLDDLLKQVQNGRRELDWLARYKIVLGEASGLEYLHVDDLLKQVQNGRRELDWLARYKIVLGEASGLEYLHVGITPRIVHRDIKPGNVLFDENMEARIADFGFAHYIPEADTYVTFSHVAGTREVLMSDDPKEAIHPTLLGNGFEEQMLLVLKLACFCSLEDPKDRPTSKDCRCMLAEIDHSINEVVNGSR